MKQNSLKLIKKRLNLLKIKKLNQRNILFNSLNNSFLNLNIKQRKYYYFKLINNNLKLKKICNINGKSKAVNKELKISRTAINHILIENQLKFFKKINNNFT